MVPKILVRQIPSLMNLIINIVFKKKVLNKKLTEVALAVQHVTAAPFGALVRGVTLAHGVHLVVEKTNQ